MLKRLRCLSCCELKPLGEFPPRERPGWTPVAAVCVSCAQAASKREAS